GYRHKRPQPAKMRNVTPKSRKSRQRGLMRGGSPHKGRGKLQVAAQRLFCIKPAISTRELCDWAFCEAILLRGKLIKPNDYARCRTALMSIGAVAIRRGIGRGRPTIWRLSSE